MKYIKSILGIMLCLFVFTACGGNETNKPAIDTMNNDTEQLMNNDNQTMGDTTSVLPDTTVVDTMKVDTTQIN